MPNAPITASQFSNWIALYNKAGVASDSLPNKTSVNFASRCGVIVSSCLRRSTHSAQLLHGENLLVSDKLFSEAGMPSMEMGILKLPPLYWAALFRLLWYFGYSRNAESYTDARSRACKAAQKLVDMAQTHQSVLCVGHGIFNRLVVRELKSQGWSGPTKPGSKHWSLAIYEKSPDNV